MTKPSEIFDTPAATGFSRVGGNEEIIEDFDRKFFIGGKNAYGEEKPLLFPAKCEVRDWLRTILTTKDQDKEEAVRAEREKIVEIIKDELRNAPLEVQMTKGIIFANVVYRIGALPTEDNN